MLYLIKVQAEDICLANFANAGDMMADTGDTGINKSKKNDM